MRSLIRSVATAVVLLADVVPGALAADPSATDGPTPVVEPTPTGPYDGTIVVDPTFVSGGVLPTQRPSRPGSQDGPRITPPPTDGVAATAPADAGLPVSVLILASSAVLALGAMPRPAHRRRSRQA
jgi:hypothetical protein